MCRVTTFEIITHTLTQFLCIFLSAWAHLHILCEIILKRLKEPFASIRQKKSGSLTSTKTGEDANAGAVCFLRYLYTFRPADYPLDSNLQYYDWLLLSTRARVIAHIITTAPLLLEAFLNLDNGFVAARTAYIDRMLADALTSPPPSSSLSPVHNNRRYKQILILGAGFDSRGCRFQNIRRDAAEGFDVWVIEVDQSSVQRKKLSRMAKRLGRDKFNQLTEGVEYVECNFDYTDALSHALQSSIHFNPALPTVVILEGVTYYIPKRAIEETLSVLSRLRSESKQPSAEWKIIFDYIDESIFSPSASLAERWFLEGVAAHNAPFRCGLPRQQDQLDDFLRPFGIKSRQLWKHSAIIDELHLPARLHTRFGPVALVDCDWVSC